MRTPSDNKAGAKDTSTPGGNAFKRIQQDRAARGLDPLPPSSKADDTVATPVKQAKPKRA
jgi:hypothetical protein